MVRRPLMTFPADDQRFRQAALLAVELFDPGDPGPSLPHAGRWMDDERLLAAAQAMLRAAYPLATIVVDPREVSASPVVWQVYRDAATLDEDLLRGARSGDTAAEARLVERYHAIAVVFAWPICGGPATAVGAVTEAMAQLLRPNMPVETEHVADTLLRLARRAAVARRRSPMDAEGDPGSEARIRLSSMLAHLSDTQAAGLALAYGEGMSEAEVAIAIGLDETRTRALIREGLSVLVEAPA
jgi:DNA-directed RNA polymerase specialized sigma24 family protein